MVVPNTEGLSLETHTRLVGNNLQPAACGVLIFSSSMENGKSGKQLFYRIGRGWPVIGRLHS